MRKPYTPEFYRTYQDESLLSARIMAPLVMGLVRPGSVVDIGCGVGTWLRVFRENGVEEILGVDGDHVDRSLLQIPEECFLGMDLARGLDVRGHFDLVVSLEVAEHLPEHRAGSFIEALASLGPVVLFSAAIPCQGGDGHVNEQWPGYWVELFSRSGYLAIDCIRPLVWDNGDVAYYYAQNSMIFVNGDLLADFPALQLEHEKYSDPPRPVVHPRKWIEANDPRSQRLRPLLRTLPHSLFNAVALRIRKIPWRF